MIWANIGSLVPMPITGFLSTPKALPILATACTTPALLGFYKSGWTVSYGYAGAIAVSGLTAISAGGLHPLASLQAVGLSLFGARLGAFLMWRNAFVKEMQETQKRMEARAPTSRLKRIPFVFGCALLYLGMVAPLVLTSRYAPKASVAALQVTKVSLAAMFVGGLIEAVGDAQKSWYKAQQGGEKRWVDKGLYAFMRHPNHSGEQLVWAGNFLAGVAPALSHISTAWPWMIGGALGLVGIQFVLVMAMTSLERKQQEKYGSEEAFAVYKRSTYSGIIMSPNNQTPKSKLK